MLFPLAAFEGPVVSLVVGFLILSGTLAFWPAYIILLFGDIIPDTIYYFLGYFSDKVKFIQKHFFKSETIKKNLDIINNLWEKYPFKMMFFSKLAYGFATPFLISAGLTKMPYKKFISYTIPITCFQYAVFVGIGYYLGKSYEIAIKYVDFFYIFMAITISIFIIFYIHMVKYARKTIISMKNKEEKI